MLFPALLATAMAAYSSELHAEVESFTAKATVLSDILEKSMAREDGENISSISNNNNNDNSRININTTTTVASASTTTRTRTTTVVSAATTTTITIIAATAAAIA